MQSNPRFATYIATYTAAALMVELTLALDSKEGVLFSCFSSSFIYLLDLDSAFLPKRALKAAMLLLIWSVFIFTVSVIKEID